MVIRDFFNDNYLFLFLFILLDLISTYYVLVTGIGYESNTFLSYFMSSYGFVSLVILKLLYLGFFFYIWVLCSKSKYWFYGYNMVLVFSVVLIFNNMCVVFGFF